MNAFLIDTSVIIDYLKGKEIARKLITSADGRLTSSYFCLAELYEGIHRVKNPKEHEKPVLSYFASLTKVYGIDINIAKKFGELRAKLKRQGNVIEDIDLFIVATAIVHDLTLITLNKKHFSHVDGLKIQ